MTTECPTAPTAAQVSEMRAFLTRIVRIPITAIKVTGDPATDENTDIVKSYRKVANGEIVEKLDPIRAIGIDSILAGEVGRINGEPDLARGAFLYEVLLAGREKIYP